MNKGICLLTLLGTLLVFGCSRSNLRPNVHVVLNDGQLLVGRITTKTFNLKTEFGELPFSTEEAGELGPLEGADMRKSERLVRLWLQDGSEFVGSWERPTVHMALTIGDDEIAIDVPIEKIGRLRFHGHAKYSDKAMYRVITQAGDDFFVDASKSRIHFEGELASFNPYLSEIRDLVRKDPNENFWHVVLANGTELHAKIKDNGLDLKPALGPKQVDMSSNLITRLEPAAMQAPGSDSHMTPSQVAEGEQFYSNELQRFAKEEAAKRWNQ
ncbi:MAG: hypothetical protein GY847_19850 [Proteobacteria bacterium]|nr:hypothetical protein [Pseudomonadota bacterium]